MKGGQLMTQEKLDWIVHHNNRLIIAAEKSLGEFVAMQCSPTDNYVLGQIAYWKHVISALKWSNQVAMDSKRPRALHERTTL